MTLTTAGPSPRFDFDAIGFTTTGTHAPGETFGHSASRPSARPSKVNRTDTASTPVRFHKAPRIASYSHSMPAFTFVGFGNSQPSAATPTAPPANAVSAFMPEPYGHTSDPILRSAAALRADGEGNE